MWEMTEPQPALPIPPRPAPSPAVWPTHRGKRRQKKRATNPVDPRPNWRAIARQLDGPRGRQPR